MTTNEIELRARLESAFLLLERIGDGAHHEECDAFNACENAHEDSPCAFDDNADERVHVHVSCNCLVWDAQTMAVSIREVLRRTLESDRGRE